MRIDPPICSTPPWVALLVLLALAQAGCAALESSAHKQPIDESVRSAQAAADAARLAATQARSALEPRYLRFKADETRLIGVLDDGRLTYLEFAGPVAADLVFFNEEGRQLASATAGRVAAVDGLHAGILVRGADRASFASPNPRALSAPRVPLPDAPDYGEARAKLENQAGQLQAMQRAMEAARFGGTLSGAGTSRNAAAGAITGPITGVAPPANAAVRSGQLLQPQAPLPTIHPWGQPGVQPWVQAGAVAVRQQPTASDAQAPLRHLPQLLRSLQREASVPPPAAAPTGLMPLELANASTSAPERGLVRVFFATASRAIVAPDDGLGLLLREAANADEIRVTGFTDATGSRDANAVLGLARADAVVQILLRRGIPADRIVSRAVGADDYIADNTSERGRALNRRAEVVLLKNGEPLAFATPVRAVR